MPHNPGGAELSGLLCRSHSRALAAGHPCRCGWLRCEATLLLPPCPASTRAAACHGFSKLFSSGHPALPAGSGCPVQWKVPCPGGCASPGCCGMARSPQSRGVWAARAGVPWEPWPVASPGRCSLLPLKSHPKGSASAQLVLASSALLLLGHDSAWHVQNPSWRRSRRVWLAGFSVT